MDDEFGNAIPQDEDEDLEEEDMDDAFDDDDIGDDDNSTPGPFIADVSVSKATTSTSQRQKEQGERRDRAAERRKEKFAEERQATIEKLLLRGAPKRKAKDRLEDAAAASRAEEGERPPTRIKYTQKAQNSTLSFPVGVEVFKFDPPKTRQPPAICAVPGCQLLARYTVPAVCSLGHYKHMKGNRN